MRKILKSKKGITLIALVVTIVILLILAGVTIATLTGENRLLKNAVTAEEKNEEKVASEKMNLKITEIQIQNYIEKQEMPTLQDLADALCNDEKDEIAYVALDSQKTASLDPITVVNNTSIFTKLKEYPYEFEIDKYLRLASVDGIQIADDSSTSSSIDLNEYNLMKETIASLSNKVKELESSQTETKSELETEIATLKQKDTSLESAISNINTTMNTLTFTELATTTSSSSTNTVTLSESLSNYKYVMVVFKGGGGTSFPSGLVSLDVFKTLSSIGSGNAGHDCYLKYVSDTACLMHVTSGSGGTAILYGIK